MNWVRCAGPANKTELNPSQDWWQKAWDTWLSQSYITELEIEKSSIQLGDRSIMDIETETGATIVVGHSSLDYFKTSAPIKILGPEDARQRAQKIIESMAKSPPLVDPQLEPGTKTFWEEVVRTKNRIKCEFWPRSPKIIKDVYREHVDVSHMPPDMVRQFLIEKHMSVSYIFGEESTHIPNVVTTFEQAFQPFPGILREIKKHNFESPTPIQSQAWPAIMKGHDVIGISPAGTGKTLAYLLPAFIHIESQPTPRSERKGANVLVVTPTRELAIRLRYEVSKFWYKNFKNVSLYDCGNRQVQTTALKNGVDVIIATPGRLDQLNTGGFVDLRSITYLVLDNADQMIDTGLMPQISKLLVDVRPDRQMIVMSATWSEGLLHLAQTNMVNPIQIEVWNAELAAVEPVIHVIQLNLTRKKPQKLIDFCRTMTSTDKLIVFVGNKSLADDLSSDLSVAGIESHVFHTGLSELDRKQALDDMKSGCVRRLVAPFEEANNLAFEDVTHVLNYEFPRNPIQYDTIVERLGQAGDGQEIRTYVTQLDIWCAKDLIKILKNHHQDVPGDFFKMADRYEDCVNDKLCFNCLMPGHKSLQCCNSRVSLSHFSRGAGVEVDQVCRDEAIVQDSRSEDIA